MIRRSVLIALAVVTSWIDPAVAEPPDDATIAWIRQHAIPIQTVEAGNGFEDLQPLKSVIGDARIVSLGESTHGSREIFQMKHRLLEFLATDMGFSLFGIEANLPEAYRINDYVLTGEGDPDRLIDGMYFWTWNTREVKGMVEWMRQFNQAGKSRVEFTGFDMQTPDVAMQEVLRFLKQTDATQHAAAQAAYSRASKARPAASAGFGVATGSFPVEAARGKKVTYRGWIKTDDVGGFAGLWWRADGPNQKVLAFNNMQSQKISGTRDWQSYSIDLDIPAEATNINFGILLAGKGTAWFDGIEVLLDDQRYVQPEQFDLDFETEEVRGLNLIPLPTYRTELDNAVAKSGQQSLRLRSMEAPVGTPPEDFKATLAACDGIHQQLKQTRDKLVKAHPTKEVDWAIVNARLVVTALEQRSGNMAIRDQAMAENVSWILDQNPDAKIVLWAHNFHVSKRPQAMGKYLDQRFGKQHLAIAFATTKGEYRAIGKQGLGNHPLQAPPAESFEAAFQRTGLPRFFLNFRAVEAEAVDSGWLAQSHSFRSIGALAIDQQFGPTPLPALFDAVIYLEETTPARPLRP